MTSAEELELKRSSHNVRWGPADHITAHQLRTLLQSCPSDDAPRNIELEATLAHERMRTNSIWSQELGALYGELYTASPVSPFDVTSSDYLGRLFDPGEFVLVTGDGGSCVLWEALTSPVIGSFKTGFFPYVIDPARIQNLTHAQSAPGIKDLTGQYKYAAARFENDEVGQLFPAFIGRRWPVAAVTSSGHWRTEVLFRVNKESHGAWKRECKSLSAEIHDQGFGVRHQFKFEEPALLPCALEEQRLIYFDPHLV